jgi:hypothetical protein
MEFFLRQFRPEGNASAILPASLEYTRLEKQKGWLGFNSPSQPPVFMLNLQLELRPSACA